MSVLRDRKAVVFAVLSVVVLFGGCVASLLLPADDQVLGVLAAVGAYIFCGRCALSRWHADERVFERSSRESFRAFLGSDEKRKSA